MTAAPPTLVDARGMKCPWPLLRLARAVRAGGAGRYRLRADDPAVPNDLAAMAAEQGWRVERVDEAWAIDVPPDATER